MHPHKYRRLKINPLIGVNNRMKVACTHCYSWYFMLYNLQRTQTHTSYTYRLGWVEMKFYRCVYYTIRSGILLKGVGGTKARKVANSKVTLRWRYCERYVEYMNTRCVDICVSVNWCVWRLYKWFGDVTQR